MPLFTNHFLVLQLASVDVVGTPLQRGDPREPIQKWHRRTSWVALEESPFSLATVELPNWTPSSRWSVGKVPMRHTRKVDYVFLAPMSFAGYPPHFRAELRPDVGHWTGGGITKTLNDGQGTSALAASLEKHQRIFLSPRMEQGALAVTFRGRAEWGLMTLVDRNQLATTGFPDQEKFQSLCQLAHLAMTSRPAKNTY